MGESDDDGLSEVVPSPVLPLADDVVVVDVVDDDEDASVVDGVVDVSTGSASSICCCKCISLAIWTSYAYNEGVNDSMDDRDGVGAVSVLLMLPVPDEGIRKEGMTPRTVLVLLRRRAKRVAQRVLKIYGGVIMALEAAAQRLTVEILRMDVVCVSVSGALLHFRHAPHPVRFAPLLLRQHDHARSENASHGRQRISVTTLLLRNDSGDARLSSREKSLRFLPSKLFSTSKVIANIG